jgi:tetratricopeptide (TPR) repeat protein
MAPDQQRKRLLATLVAWTIGFAKAQPLVLATEDLHWADPSTLELAQLLIEQSATAPLLLLYTARPEFHAPWPMRAHHTQINLNRLTTRNVRTMVAQVAAKIALSDETVATVVERTGGVPLFVEELTRAVLESSEVKLTGREIPATLHDSLMARLDRLGPAKEVIQVGAVIGGEFSYELLRAVHPLEETELQAALRTLADAELLYVRGIAPDATYQFKHTLIRDAAYEALLKSRRKDLHLMVARTIEQQFPTFKETQPEVLARHWTEAGETERAIGQWSRASKAAESRNAFVEAQESYQQALTLLKLLPESPERDVSELQLRQSLVSMLHMTRGWAAPETMEAAERAGTLAQKSGNLRQLVGSMTSRCLHAFISADLSIAGALADQALRLALREANPTVLANLHMMQLVIRHARGDLAGSEQYFSTGLEFFEDANFRQNPNGGSIVVFGTASRNAWMLGRADVACERMAKMMAVVNRANPHDLPWSDVFAAVVYVLTGENEHVETLAARALEVCEKYQFPNEAAFSRCLLGTARAHMGRTSEGIALIREGIAALLKIGNRITVTLYMNSLAAAQKLDGAIADALDTIEQALQFNPAELIHRPETFRLRGELRLEQGQLELAGSDFREAIALAQSMSAKSWELRTTMSLARLLARQDRRDEARTILAEIYNWFTEGFDTADLKDAQALLDQLAT